MTSRMTEDSNNSVTFNESKGYIYVNLAGKLSSEKILSIVQQVINCPQQWRDKAKVYDVSDADLSEMNHDSLFNLSKRILDAPRPEFTKTKIIIVSEKKLNLSSAQLFKEYYNDEFSRIIVLDSLKKAELWIAENYTAGDV
jgi:hypothetical protein